MKITMFRFEIQTEKKRKNQRSSHLARQRDQRVETLYCVLDIVLINVIHSFDSNRFE